MTRREHGICPTRRINSSSAGPLPSLQADVAALGSRLLHMYVVGIYSCLSLDGLAVLITTSVTMIASMCMAMPNLTRWPCLSGEALLRNQYLKGEQ